MATTGHFFLPGDALSATPGEAGGNVNTRPNRELFSVSLNAASPTVLVLLTGVLSVTGGGATGAMAGDAGGDFAAAGDCWEGAKNDWRIAHGLGDGTFSTFAGDIDAAFMS